MKMKNQKLNELNFLSEFDDSQIKQLWNNCFSTPEDLNFINRHVPFGLQLPGNFNLFESFLKNNRTWLIQRVNDSEIIGYMIFGNFIASQPSSIGIVIGKSYSGNSYGSKSVEALCDILKNENYKLINGYCSSENKGAIKIMEKNGFNRIRDFKEYGITVVQYQRDLSKGI
jgi:RimJ/RimL family protein N-acetyltransferase